MISLRKFVVATSNQGKLREINALLGNLNIEAVPMIEFDGIGAVAETGATFEENAAIKAEYTARIAGLPAIADDSGLMVSCLHGAPGVYSARFAGEPSDDDANNRKLLALMEGKQAGERQASFICVAAFAVPGEKANLFRGECTGSIGFSAKGSGGFGYDPLFVVDGKDGLTFAELSDDEKNLISHRGKAFSEMLDYLAMTMEKGGSDEENSYCK